MSIKHAIEAGGTWRGGTPLVDQLKEAERAIAEQAAWIQRALPWLEAYAETMRDSTQEWDKNNTVHLDALIKEATE